MKRPRRSFWVSGLAFVAVGSLSWFGADATAGVTAPTLLRYPYLQQVTQTSAMIVWTTAEGGASEVRYDAAASMHTVPATSELFQEPQIEGQVSQSYYVHVAQLNGLEPGTTYSYSVVTDGEDLTAGDELAFATDRGPVEYPLSLLAFGDSGDGGNNQRAIRDAMLMHQFDLGLHTGDIAYVYATYRDFDTNHFAVYPQLTSKVPLYPVLGNHEYLTLDGQPYLDVFFLPENAPTTRRERYYSFDYGPVHFVALDGEILGDREGGPGAADEMLEWLRTDLATTKQSWKIVYAHKTPYGSSDLPIDLGLDRVAPVLDEFGVDLYVAGHDHVYERTIPLKAGVPTTIGQGGIPYVVTGGAGAGLHFCMPRSYTLTCIRTYNFLDITISDDCTLQYYVRGFGTQVHENFVLNRCDPDSDTDGLSDSSETGFWGTDPINADTDADGLRDGAEVLRGTNGLNPDTDGDGYLDGEEVSAGSNPLDPQSIPEPTPTPTGTPTQTPPPNQRMGDANCDDLVNSVDATFILQWVAGLLAGLPCDVNADVTEDGHVNAIDASLVLQYVAGLVGDLG